MNNWKLIDKLPPMYVVRVTGDGILTGLVFDASGHNVFATTSLEDAKSYAKQCRKENNQLYRPKYYVCAVVCL